METNFKKVNNPYIMSCLLQPESINEICKYLEFNE